MRGRGRPLARSRPSLRLWQLRLLAGLCARALWPGASRARRCRAAPMLRFPTCFPSFRVVGEKQLPQEIIFLAWSPKRDLIALANTTGEVSELVRGRLGWDPRASVSPLADMANRTSLLPRHLSVAVNFKRLGNGPCLPDMMYFPFPVWPEQIPSQVLPTQVSRNWFGQGCNIRPRPKLVSDL